ncbi:sarcosine oxidase subunit gamma [Litoreibacter janthinus]|uniref:Sarcosine oxidase subunit gamma n=1 Tax=Litoreibacter janthinus TaxID=670154 RepID=A0A1I6GXQ5_9RHOB|nr:sarcosine oxidase subunit gamma family protein [Litoreibacter janthinus]SFR47043.1 sarcosine oxidase subunit gamma [Litoreibacter janthinus]
MSNPVSALQGVVSEGFAKVTEAGLRGMITLRGDQSSRRVKDASTDVAGVDFPGTRECNCVGEMGIAWMSPDELLVMTPYAEVVDATARIAEALKEEHALVVNVSDARAVFIIEGAGAREVLAKLCPVDLSRDVFRPGMFRRTRLAQAPVAFWARDETTFELVCFRSEAQYVFDVLSMSAKTGSEVNYL